MSEPKPKTADFGLRAAMRRAKIGKEDLAKTEKMIDKLTKAFASEKDKRTISDKSKELDELKKTGEVD
jgi:hypothetical protein